MPTLSLTVEPATPAHSPTFSLLRSATGGPTRLVVAGELDIATLSEFDQALRRADADADAGMVVVDLRLVEFVDSSVAALLVAADRRVRRAGGRLVVVRGPAEVEWFFALIGIERQLELVDLPPAETGAPAREGMPA